MTLKEYVKSDREQYEALRQNATRIEFGGDYHRPGEPCIAGIEKAIHTRPASDCDIPSHDDLVAQSLFAVRICGAMPDPGTQESMKAIRERPDSAYGIPLVVHVPRDGYEEAYAYSILAAVTPFGSNPKKDELIFVAVLSSLHIVNRSIPDGKVREERGKDNLTVGNVLDRMASILNIGGDTGKCTCEQASKDDCMCSNKDSASPTFAFRSFTDKDTGKDSNKDTGKDGKDPKASNDPKAASNAPKTDKNDKDDTKGWKIGSYTIRVETKDGKTTITTSTDGGPEQTTTLDSDDGIGYPASTWSAFSRMESELDCISDKFGRIGRLFDRLW